MARYEPETLTGPTLEAIIEQVNREFQRVSNGIHTVDDLESSFAVQKPLEGMFRFFDPNIYAPGEWKGIYVYQDGEWKYVGPLPDTLPSELWYTDAHGTLTLLARDIVPAFSALLPGAVAQAFTIDGNGVFTAQARFLCAIQVSCLFTVILNANNQDINWAIFDNVVGATVFIPPIGEFVASPRIVTFQKTSMTAGNALFDVGDTIQWQSQVLSRTGTTPTVDLDEFAVIFSNIRIVP